MNTDGRINHYSQLCNLKEYVSQNGKSRNMRIFEIDNGVLSFDVTADRCMDIVHFRHLGENLSFISKNGICAEGDYFGTFPGGMVYTCGLDSLGGREGFPFHGGIHNVPARITEAFCDGYNVRLTGEMSDTRLFGRNLTLKRTIETSYGSGKVVIRNELINRGNADEPYVFLFHINFGYPMLDEGAEIKADIADTIARTPFAKARRNKCLVMDAPVDEEEQVFYHTLKERGVSVVNKKLKREFKIDYDTDKLPFLVEWKSMLYGDYALGIEPSTTFMDDFFNYSSIEAGQSVNIDLTLEIKSTDG